MYVHLLMLICFVSLSRCFTPNCVPENQFRNYGFPVEACSENFQGRCKFHPKGYFKSLGEASLVKIKETSVVPTCAFFGADSLRYIYGVNSKIKVLATEAFINLPNLEGVYLAFNHITEVRKGIFKNVTLKLLDLSWNKIAFVDSHAFNEVHNLLHLNLSRNSLHTISVNHLAQSLVDINLSHNFLESFAINSDKFTNLSSIDASHNKISKVAISFRHPAYKIDLTDNRIHNFDYMDITSVKKFKMGKNLFEEAPQYLENINVNEIDIYPNPWKCEKLFLLWETLVSFNIRLAPRAPEKNPPPECFQTENTRLVTTTRSTDCLGDHECPTYMACRANKCWDPCDESFCHKSSLCESKNHVFNCSCNFGLLANPLDIHGECKNVGCYTDDHCAPGFNCWNEECVKIAYSTTPRPLIVGGFAPTLEPANAYAPPLEPANGYAPVARELPWWYEDIPSVIPPEPTPKKKTDFLL